MHSMSMLDVTSMKSWLSESTINESHLLSVTVRLLATRLYFRVETSTSQQDRSALQRRAR